MEELLLAFIETLDESYNEILKEVGAVSGLSKLTVNHVQYIDAIYTLKEPTITELATKLQITKASVTNGIQKLVDMGFVTKTQSSEDRRVFHVRLTDTGFQLMEAKYKALKKYVNKMTTALEPEERKQFEGSLAKIVKLFRKA